MSRRPLRSLSVQALPTAHRFAPGDDVATTLLATLADHAVGLEDGDILCVASKVIALAEGAVIESATLAVTDGSDESAQTRALARARSSEVVVDADWLTVTRTQHGFVAANGGIDRSNVPGDRWLDLPVDPDASARALQLAIRTATGRHVGVLVTDTFGRAWRTGQTDVALGAAGLHVLRDERGGRDLDGRPLLVTMSAIGDELAGAADLVRDKSSGAPFVLIRGLAEAVVGADHDPTDMPSVVARGPQDGRSLIRPVEEDLFRWGGAEAVLHGLAGRRTVRRFDPARAVSPAHLARAVAMAASAPAPHHTQPWRFVRLTDPTRGRLLDAMADQWREDLRSDGVPASAIEARISRSDALLRVAPVLLAAFVDLSAAHPYPDERRQQAERDLFVLAGGAAIEAVLVALAAQGLGAAWVASTTFCAPVAHTALGLPDSYAALGMLAIGHPLHPPQPRDVPSDTADPGALLDER
jgi:coenzyme F420-0:L-glutamate ligase / coenzyme F420-1:gamma-L-glutamate ligase